MRDPFGQVHKYVETLLQGRKPKRISVDDERDWKALQFAARLAGERAADTAGPSPEFVARLQARMVAEATGQKPAQASRRGLLAAALSGLAAGAGGFLAGRTTAPTPAEPPTQVAPASRPPMVRDNGQWFEVTKLSAMATHGVTRFSAGAVEGHLVRMGNKVYALSAICSDAPCSLAYQETKESFLCPCHGVQFDMGGEAFGNRRPVPPLTPIQVRIDGDDVLVWSIGETPHPESGTPRFD